MKFYGNANLQQNELQNAVLPFETTFPASPKVGQIAFVHSIVYICVSVANDLPVWVPMTREITAFTHNQSSPADTWTITHNLNSSSVQVQIFDGNNRLIIPDEIELVSLNVAEVTFVSPMVGRAVVVSGHFDGSVKPSYSYTHYQSSSSTTWTMEHNLGHNPIVRAFVGNQEVQPASIVHNSVNEVTITFTSPQVGYARLL